MKKIICALLIVLMIISLCACSNSEQTSNIDQTYEADTEYSYDEVEDETEDENPELDIKNTDTYKLAEGSSAFNENGVAWARIEDEESNEIKTALINTNGEILHIIDFFEDYENPAYGTPFINGLSAVYQYDGSSFSGFTIVNESGKEVYSSDDLYMCGQAEDGTFILAKHDSGFDRDKWYAYLLDTDLKLTKTKIELDEEAIEQGDSMKTIQALSDGMYYLPSSDSLLNVPLKKYFSLDTGDDYMMIHGHDEKYAYLSCEHFYHYPLDQLKKAKSAKEIEKSVSSVAVSGYYKNKDNDGNASYFFKKWKKGSIYYSNGTHNKKYIDIKGNTIFKFPKVSNDASIDDVDDFSGKYAAIYMTGVDENLYVSIVDEKGKMQYDPVQVSNDTHCSCDGYVFFYSNSDGAYSVITPDGSEKEIGDNLSGLKGPIVNTAAGENSQHSITNIYYGIEIGGGYIFYREEGYKYVSTDGKTTIDEVTANYNSDGNLVYTDKNGKTVVNSADSKKENSSDEESTDDNTSDTTTTQKDYINIDDFSIIGKWKNVGTDTYGQAQKGAIIIFNGTNCNFFSPKDTYAFYKDGDDYKLECTSPLADTVSFTVKIVDENNIDIINSSNTVELKRVN